MGSKGYLVLAAASIIGMVAAFIFFVIALASDELYSKDPSVLDILLPIFLYLGLVMLFVFLLVYSLIKYDKSKRHTQYEELTKKCISCGTTIGLTELSCPRCFTLQPPGGSSPSFFRRKR